MCITVQLGPLTALYTLVYAVSAEEGQLVRNSDVCVVGIWSCRTSFTLAVAVILCTV